VRQDQKKKAKMRSKHKNYDLRENNQQTKPPSHIDRKQKYIKQQYIPVDAIERERVHILKVQQRQLIVVVWFRGLFDKYEVLEVEFGELHGLRGGGGRGGGRAEARACLRRCGGGGDESTGKGKEAARSGRDRNEETKTC
jgi:hypothetical protein